MALSGYIWGVSHGGNSQGTHPPTTKLLTKSSSWTKCSWIGQTVYFPRPGSTTVRCKGITNLYSFSSFSLTMSWDSQAWVHLLRFFNSLTSITFSHVKSFEVFCRDHFPSLLPAPKLSYLAYLLARQKQRRDQACLGSIWVRDMQVFPHPEVASP